MTKRKAHARSQPSPRMIVSAAELLVHRTRLQLQLLLGEPVDDSLPIEVVEHRLAGPEGRAWGRLVELFGLSASEADLLAMALAFSVEPALGPMIAKAQAAAGRFLPTESLVKIIHGHRARPIYRPTSPLSMWRLVTPVRMSPGEAPGFEADRQLLDWMFGNVSLDAELVLAVDACPTMPVPAEWPVIKTAERMDQALRAGAELRIVIPGRIGSGRRRFAAAVAKVLDREALSVDATVIPQGDWAETFMLAQRFACFADAALIWRVATPAWPNKIPMAPLQFICTAEGEAPPQRDSASDLTISVPELTVDSKSAIFADNAPHLAESARKLAAIPGLLLGDLHDVARTAPPSSSEAADELRARARTRMSGAGTIIDPIFGWDDMVAPESLLSQLKRIAFEARTRPQIMERPETARLYFHAAGLSALFSGPPGVGKSMAAHVIARDLGANLLVIDLATTTSKFIGETAKNLSQAFAQAKASGAALIFEEADAFFARRTDVQNSNDRYANTDTNHLLQLLEAHDGLVILSTNRRANIDPAFIRRLRHVVEFPKPGPAERRELWRRMLTGLGVYPAPLEDTIAGIADTHDVSPAQIKSAALSALYCALHGGRAITPDDLTMAMAQELAKEGRSAPIATVKPRRRRRSHNG